MYTITLLLILQADVNSGFDTVYSYFNTNYSCDRVYMLDIVLNSPVKQYNNTYKNNDVYFERDNTRTFCVFYKNDQFGRSKLREITEKLIEQDGLCNPYIYILRPLNRKDLIGIKYSRYQQNRLIMENAKLNENESLVVPAKLTKLIVNLK